MTIQHAFLQFCFAFLGTGTFALLYQVPIRFILAGGFTGAAGWLLYIIFSQFSPMITAVVLAAMTVSTLSRFYAVRLKCPATLFLLSGIFPLVPGTNLFFTCYYFIYMHFDQAAGQAITSMTFTGGIVLGITLSNGIAYCLKALRRRLNVLKQKR